MDVLINQAGGFGRYQKMMLAIVGSVSSLASVSTYLSIFTNASPTLTCIDKSSGVSVQPDDICKGAWSNFTADNENSQYNCTFDRTYYGDTIVTEWGLVCDKMKWTSMTQTMFMLGALSSFFAGYFSDKYGRRIVCMTMSTILSLTVILCEALQSQMFDLDSDSQYTVFLVTQFLVGFTSFTLYVVSYIILMEIVPQEKSMLATVVNINAYVVGELCVLAAGYFLRNWHFMNYFLTGYSIVVLALILFILPESPKFLIANKRYEEASKLLTKIARFNGLAVSITDKDVESVINSKDESMHMLEGGETKTAVKMTVGYYLTHPWTNLLKTIALGYLFAAMSGIYFGVSLGITSISDNFNPYLMLLLSCLAEVIGYTSGVIDKWISRRNIMSISLAIAGIMCITVAFIPKGESGGITWNTVLTIVSAAFGKMAASAAFNVIYLYASEFFPTCVRNTLVSYVSCAGRIGSLISPQINMLRHAVWAPLPYIIFSSNGFLSSFILFLMPDTESLNLDC